MVIAIVLTVLAATLGLVFSIIVSTGLTRPVHRLLEGAGAQSKPASSTKRSPSPRRTRSAI
jgi:hypothetical protein